jgi:hypothetical protein
MRILSKKTLTGLIFFLTPISASAQLNFRKSTEIQIRLVSNRLVQSQAARKTVD